MFLLISQAPPSKLNPPAATAFQPWREQAGEVSMPNPLLDQSGDSPTQGADSCGLQGNERIASGILGFSILPRRMPSSAG